MKQLIGHDIGSYTFNAASKTITFNNITLFTLDQILLITNSTSGIIIFNFADPLAGGILVNNVLTLTYNTTAMANTDALQIYVDLPSTVANDNAAMIDNYTHVLLERIATAVGSLATQDQQQRQRVSIDAAPASLTVGTLPTLANVTTLGTLTTVSNPVPLGNLATLSLVDPKFLFIDIARNAYATGIRTALIFS